MRFGKLKLLSSMHKRVSISVNGAEPNTRVKLMLGLEGEAYFIRSYQEDDSMESSDLPEDAEILQSNG